MVADVRGISGRLISSSFAGEVLPGLAGYEPVPHRSGRQIEAIVDRGASTLGPASAVRAIADTVVIPLLQTLGWAVDGRREHPAHCWLRLRQDTADAVNRPCRQQRVTGAALVVGWNAPLSPAWGESVRRGVDIDSPWVFCSNGTTLRIVDARRTWSRDCLEFDLNALADNGDARAILWSVMRADALAAASPLLDRAVVLSAQHALDVCRALGDGVLDALQVFMSALAATGRRRLTPDLLLDQSLTALYRILFLLFAEARGLVPLWHPIYRDRYSLESIVSALLQEGRQRGLWRAVQAISRLAHAGCSAGELTVTAFNGRLFAPSHASAFEHAPADDEAMARVLVAIATTAGTRAGGRDRITYRDLDVEQLGAVYERVLDYEVRSSGRATALVRGGDVRKSTGTFYTPRPVTSHLVRRTLAPLVADRPADAILRLRILDPAMGSGAFLVAACRYLAAAVEHALIRDGEWQPHDVTTTDRVALRREIGSKCLFGVDLNPMAVQLARLSLWLATLSADKPLSFLDHHLIVGNSLIGARPEDVWRQPSGTGHRARRGDDLPLFDALALESTLAAGVAVREGLTSDPDDSADIVRSKEQRLALLLDPGAALGRWSRVLDLWCAGWFWQRSAPPDRRLFGELVDQLLQRERQLPKRLAEPLLDESDEIATRHRFLHWPLVFPEVFCDSRGTARADSGFDAVIGNPPWDMVRGDGGACDARDERRAAARQLTDFVRESGIYNVQSRAHTNSYQLFLQRALQLVRPGGRVGLVLPAGIVGDTGAAPLRRFLFDRAEVDEITGLDNRDGIFPIHRSVRFVLVTCTAGRPTASVRCRFGISRPEVLERDDAAIGASITLTRAFLTRLSGADDLGVPELAGDADLRLLERLSASTPALEASDGWNVRFGRELNATDDRSQFEPCAGTSRATSTARPVVEGKQIEPFRVFIDRARYQLRRDAAVRVPRRPRLAYRDIASATNRLTLIAAIVPARAVTTHTLLCLKTPLPLDTQLVLCGLLNSYVANYLVRFRVNTHVTATLVSRLRVPVLRPGELAFERIRALVRALLNGREPAEEMEAYAELQALVARLYGLTGADLEHVLATFPLVPDVVRTRVLSRFNGIHG